MKRAIVAVLALCSVAVVAEELKQPPAPPPTDTTPKLVLPEGWTVLPDGSIQTRDGRVLKLPNPGRLPLSVYVAPNTCYFIRMMKPIPVDSDAPKSGLVPLQARTAGTVEGSVCTSGGGLQPLVPVERTVGPEEQGRDR